MASVTQRLRGARRLCCIGPGERPNCPSLGVLCTPSSGCNCRSRLPGGQLEHFDARWLLANVLRQKYGRMRSPTLSTHSVDDLPPRVRQCCHAFSWPDAVHCTRWYGNWDQPVLTALVLTTRVYVHGTGLCGENSGGLEVMRLKRAMQVGSPGAQLAAHSSPTAAARGPTRRSSFAR